MGRTYLVTGANRGIGLEFARQILDGGDEVIATARKPEEAKQLKELTCDALTILPLDVTSQESVDGLAKSVASRTIDVLINNAGISNWSENIASLDIGDVQRVFEVNVKGPIRVTKAVLPMLMKGNDPVIAHITSKMGSIEDNSSGGSYSYRISKAALNMFNKSLSQDDHTSGVTCVVLHPGWVQTDMGGSNARITPSESVAGLLKVIRGLKTGDSGKFYDYAGEEIPW